MNRLTLARRPLMGMVLLGVMTTAPFSLLAAHAQVNTCRSDPHVFLSNGVKVDLAMNFYDVQTDVQSATFTLHIPKNAAVNSVVYTDAVPETLTVIADNPGHRYTATGTGFTKHGGVSVTEIFNIVNQSSDGSQLSQSSGTSGQPVTIDTTTSF